MKTTALFFALTACAAFADIDRTKKPEPGPAPAAAFPDYGKEKLSNGLKVYVVEDDRKPTITLRLLLKAGNILDGDKPGKSDFVATLLNRGTKNRDAATFAEAVESLGGVLEATSGEDGLSVSISGLTKFADPLLDLFADAVMNPVFDEEQFAKEKKRAISNLIAQKKNPGALAGNLMNKTLFGAHPYGQIMTQESVEAITREDLSEFHNTWFVPANASLVVVGDVKTADILPKLEKVFADWKAKPMPEIKPFSPITPIKGLTIHLLDRPGSVQSNIIVALQGPPRNNPDLPELNVMNSTLGGGFSGRLFQNLREKHGYTYGSSSAFGYYAQAGFFQATAESRNDVTAESVKEILNEIKRIRNDAVELPELDLQRQYNTGNYLLSLENASRVATRVQDIDFYDLPPDFYKVYAKRMSEVTPEKVQELAKKYLSTENIAIIVVGEAKQIKASLEKLGTVIVYDTDYQVVK